MLCRDQQGRLFPAGSHERSVNAVSTDVDRLLGPKSLQELASLERQINTKLQSDEPIDVEYWEQLLRNIAVYKAKAQLDDIYKAVIEDRLRDLKKEQIAEAELASERLSTVLSGHYVFERERNQAAVPTIGDLPNLAPEPHLKLGAEDKSLEVILEGDFMDRLVSI